MTQLELVYCVECKAAIIFQERFLFERSLIFKLLILKVVTAKKLVLYSTVTLNALERFRLFTHSHIASFLIMPCIYETKNIVCLKS